VSGFRITPIEVLVVVLCLFLVAVLVVPAILMSREESRSLTCQSHQVDLVLALRAQIDQEAIDNPIHWPEQLAKHLKEPSIIEHCPSDERWPPTVSSYGINGLVAQFSERNSETIIFIDYNALVVLLNGGDVVSQWKEMVAPRHFEFVNAAFYDSHIELKDPASIAPGEANGAHFWMPQEMRNSGLSNE